jgi:asparagine synthase (glutamine-hydrolysing)
MCGILGIWHSHAADQPPCLSALRHRGPDDQGLWCSADRRCWLGHTRLAIQDLSPAGHQPMTSACGRFTIVFNGEIYNHQALRRSLRHSSWRGHSDTETLLQGLVEQGSAFLQRLRGMYAFAAYDKDQEQLWLARDRFGIKPLYLSWHGDGLQFASERRALLQEFAPPPQAISQLLAWGHFSTDPYVCQLPSATVQALPPGSLLLIQSGHPPRIRQHWPLARLQPDTHTTLRRTLETVVEEQLLADVPVACFLSSGLDSGILTALACRMQPGRIASFTVAFPGMELDESRQARRMAKHCGSEHHELQLGLEQTLAWVEDGLRALDQPSADGLNTYLVSRAVAEQGIKVALSGLGADELFGGYPSHRLVPWLQLLRWLPRRQRLAVVGLVSERLHHKLQDVMHWDPWHLSLALRRWASDPQLKAAGVEPLHWPVPVPYAPRERWGQISWSELFGYTEPMLLRDSDVMSMAHGLEIRVPFLDDRVISQALSLPPWSHRPGKSALRRACADLFPSGYLRRRKQGFSLPMAAWMKAELRLLCLQRLDALAELSWLQEPWIRSQWRAFEQGLLPWPRAWMLVVLGEFARRAQHQGQSAITSTA